MATTFLNIFTIFVLLSSVSILATTGEEKDNFSTTVLKRKPLKEKLTRFRVYWHDIQSGSNPTSVQIVKPTPSQNFNPFGVVNMIDNPLTSKPELNSTEVGKAQGFYAVASQEELGLLMTMNFVFTVGKYNGSTISILGRNAVSNQVREMPVIGGSGLFRFARGYTLARTVTLDLKTRDATIQYDVYVIHY